MKKRRKKVEKMSVNEESERTDLETNEERKKRRAKGELGEELNP